MATLYSKPAASEPAWWFVISADHLFLDESGEVPFGSCQQLGFPDLADYQVIELGELRERSCYLVMADYMDEQFTGGEFAPLRQLLATDDMEKFAMAGRARQFSDFLNTHRFCGRCGVRMQAIDWELAMHCNQCHHRCYPRVSPCIIVAIRKNDKILLAQEKRRTSGLYSILAGFVEAGESLEQALKREVYEEAGIRVKNIQYHLSQSWSFPHSLMMGFTAEWAEGELHIDPHELLSGDWFAFDDLPPVPPEGTIARTLISLSERS